MGEAASSGGNLAWNRIFLIFLLLLFFFDFDFDFFGGK